MKEIGGYFELELAQKKEFHTNVLRLNSGRNSLKYILKAQNPKKVYLPAFICDSIIEPLEELSISFEFYNIDENFEIVPNLNVQGDEKLLYVNYFALKSIYIKKLADKYSTSLIIDNTQAFFDKPIKNIDTIYSPRKFFGVSDGGYLSTTKVLSDSFDSDESYLNSIHLLGRVDKSATSLYNDYQKAEERLIKQPIKIMSKLTKKILSSIDYKEVENRRKENFNYLDNELKNLNVLKIANESELIPFVYPLMVNDENLRLKLIENKIYVAKYWNEVLKREKSTKIEKDFVNKIIPLPIDQRYCLIDMKQIVKVIKENLNA